MTLPTWIEEIEKKRNDGPPSVMVAMESFRTDVPKLIEALKISMDALSGISENIIQPWTLRKHIESTSEALQKIKDLK